MRHSFFASSRPLVFAHRGGSLLAPENTIAAFETGLAHGADGLELDVHLSLDGIVVVHHDRTLERTTDLEGPVVRRTADELARADAACRFERHDPRLLERSSVGIPTLDDVLGLYPDTRVVVELKVNSADLARAVIAVIRRHDAVERVSVGSFGLGAIRTVRALEPRLATSAAREEVRWALYRSWFGWPIGRVPYVGFQVPERSGGTRVVSPRFVQAAHRAGLAVHVWTVDREDDARRLLGWGVDGLITDRPDLIVPLVAAGVG